LICLFSGGILNGLQFEMEKPPHRISTEYLHHLPMTLKAIPYDQNDPTVVVPYKRGSEVYIATTVNIHTGTHLDGELQGQVVVYLLEREW
jgi:hypothetical protein